MARGWESKSIEAQQEEAVRQHGQRLRSPDEIAHAERRQGLELTRARAVADLARATAPPHRRMLEEAIAALDAQLAGED